MAKWKVTVEHAYKGVQPSVEVEAATEKAALAAVAEQLKRRYKDGNYWAAKATKIAKDVAPIRDRAALHRALDAVMDGRR